MKEKVQKIIRKNRRQTRIRKKILASSKMPRLTVFRSNKYIYAQIIDDIKGVTLVSASEKRVAKDVPNRTQRAEEVGKQIALLAKEKKIKGVVFDKGSYRYHGRVKALAEAARREGLAF